MYILCVMTHNTVFLWTFYPREWTTELSADHILFFNGLIYSFTHSIGTIPIRVLKLPPYVHSSFLHCSSSVRSFCDHSSFRCCISIGWCQKWCVLLRGRALKASETKQISPVLHLAFIPSVGRLRNRKAACTWHMTVISGLGSAQETSGHVWCQNVLAMKVSTHRLAFKSDTGLSMRFMGKCESPITVVMTSGGPQQMQNRKFCWKK